MATVDQTVPTAAEASNWPQLGRWALDEIRSVLLEALYRIDRAASSAQYEVLVEDLIANGGAVAEHTAAARDKVVDAIATLDMVFNKPARRDGGAR